MSNQAADIPIKIELFGIKKLDAVIMRHICPISADAIIDKMPFALRGRFNFGSKKYWTLPGIGIRKGLNQTKATKEAMENDIVYNPKTDELMIMLESILLPNSVNKIGEVKSDLEPIKDARNGLNTKFYKKK